MDRVTELGKALAQLRLLQNLSIEACASLVGTTVETLMAAERGDIDPTVLEGLARIAAARAMDDRSSHTLEGALEALSQGRPIAAGDALVEHFDDLFLSGELEVARRLLVRLDPQRLPPRVLSGVPMVSKHAREALGDARTDFFERARTALSETWRLRPEQVEAICQRHA